MICENPSHFLTINTHGFLWEAAPPSRRAGQREVRAAEKLIIEFGCDDDGNIVGVTNANKLLEDIPNKIRDSMGIIVGVDLLTKGNKEYIEIDIPFYPIGISCKGVYYYRSGSTRQILTGPALEAFLLRKHGAR